MKSSPELTDFFIATPEEGQTRLDKLLALHFPEHSRTYFQFLIAQGGVLVNGAVVKKRELVKAGDEIEVCFLLTPEISLEPQDIPLDILYEDEYLIAVNKPANMVVHPAPGHPKDTFVNALLFHCRQLHGTDPLRPGIVHRLDKDTTGVLVAAKTPLAHTRLVALFSERKIQKYYRAICLGHPKEVVIEAPIARHPTKRKEMAVCFSSGKEAKSVCKVIDKNTELSYVEIQLITGRTHQIRVHLKYCGAPILGDPVYGCSKANKKFGAHTQMLHAYRIVFLHPFTGALLDLTAPIPKFFTKYIQTTSKKNSKELENQLFEYKTRINIPS